MSLEVLEWYFVSASVAIIIISCLLLVGRNFVLCSNIKDTAGAQSVAWSKRTALYLKCLRISYLLLAGLFITLSPFRTILLATFTTWECWPYLSPSPSISSCSSTRYVCVSLGVRDRSKSPMTPMDRFPWELRRSQFTPILNCTLTKERAQSSVPSQMPRKAGCMCFWESKWNLSWLWLKRAPCCGGFAPSVPRIIQLNFLLVMMPGCDMTLFG